MIHIVQAGDTLYQLSQKYSVTIDSLKNINNLYYDGLWIGQRLTIPLSANSSNSNASTTTSQLKVYTVQKGDSLYKIALKFEVSIDELKRINNLTSNLLNIGQQLKVPDANAASNTDSNSNSNQGNNSDNTTNWSLYTVKSGDSLYKIATEYNVTVDYIIQVNQLYSNNLYIGQQLKLPSKNNTGNTSTPDNQEVNTVIYTVKSGDSLYSIAANYKTTVDAIRLLNRLTSNALSIGQKLKISTSQQSGNTNSSTDSNTNSNTDISDKEPNVPNTDVEYEYYQVQSGDSLWSIAQLFSVSVAEIADLNNLTNNSLTIGQLLKIRPKNTSTPVIEEEVGLNFQYKFSIQDSVGACDQNYASDVRKVQERLLQLGFLSQTDFEAEQSPFSTMMISRWQLTQTIEAIKVFQKEVMQTVNQDGCILPEHESLMFLNTAVAPLSASQLQQIQAAYQIFNFKATNGKSLMGNLQKAVGATNYGNLKEDVINVQQRLVELTNLSQWHGETPKTTQVAPSALNHTITALKRFQTDRVAYWRGKTASLGATAQSYQYGIAAPNDLTHHLLQHYTDYTLTFPLPNNPAQRESAEFHDFVKTSFTADITGISYVGKAKTADISLWEYRQLGLDNLQARALQYVSQHEGNFDAINSYDKALFSWGFIQFAGGTGGLVSMLAMMKHLQPNTFKTYFQDFGIDVEYSIHTVRKDIREANLVIFDRFSGKLYRGIPAQQYLKDNKILFGIFIRAGYDKNVQLAQIRAAKDKYVDPAINIKLDIRVPVVQKLASNKTTVTNTYISTSATNYKTVAEYRTLKSQGRIRESVIDFGGMPISKIIRSEMGITVLIDLTVNQWIHSTRDLFMEAIYKIAMQDHLSTLNKILTVNELKVLKEMETKAEPKLFYRIQNIRLNSSLSSAK
ncbi:MAG: LysM peptidoglycan-binding domain-containing protein [Chitinophagales bacterium]